MLALVVSACRLRQPLSRSASRPSSLRVGRRPHGLHQMRLLLGLGEDLFLHPLLHAREQGQDERQVDEDGDDDDQRQRRRVEEQDDRGDAGHQRRR